MRLILPIFFFFILSIPSKAQSYQDSLLIHRQKINQEFGNPATTILEKEDLESFTGLPFFPVDERFRVKARLELLPPSDPFRMKTSDRRMRAYERYALATFELEGKSYTLTLFQSVVDSFDSPKEQSLFLPFSDQTSGNESYGGGRYLDFAVPEGDFLIIDFNLAYNPYCAYSAGYSCPIPPKENQLPIAITAGVRYND